MSAYRGEPGGPSDPATPGGYCLARCYCGTCPQYAAQRRAVEALRAQEVAYASEAHPKRRAGAQ